MKSNKKIAVALIALGLVSGGIATIGLQTHAAQQISPAPIISIQSQLQQKPASMVTDKNINVSTVKDNIQQQGGLDNVTESSGEKSDASEADGNLQNGGHADTNNSTIDHQFNGVE